MLAFTSNAILQVLPSDAQSDPFFRRLVGIFALHDRLGFSFQDLICFQQDHEWSAGCFEYVPASYLAVPFPSFLSLVVLSKSICIVSLGKDVTCFFCTEDSFKDILTTSSWSCLSLWLSRKRRGHTCSPAPPPVCNSMGEWRRFKRLHMFRKGQGYIVLGQWSCSFDHRIKLHI